jgi:hypothetical protein
MNLNWRTKAPSDLPALPVTRVQVETPLALNCPCQWPVECAGNSVSGMPLMDANEAGGKGDRDRARRELEDQIPEPQQLEPGVPGAQVNPDRHTRMCIPTKQYTLTSHLQQLYWYCAASASVGTPNPICIPHLGAKLVRKAPEEDEEDANMTRRGDVVDSDESESPADALGFNLNVSAARAQADGPWESAIRQLGTLCRGHVSVRVKPRSMMN